jgi:hypothetical protein
MNTSDWLGVVYHEKEIVARREAELEQAKSLVDNARAQLEKLSELAGASIAKAQLGLSPGCIVANREFRYELTRFTVSETIDGGPCLAAFAVVLKDGDSRGAHPVNVFLIISADLETLLERFEVVRKAGVQ